MANRLRPAAADLLREQPLTYPEVGGSLGELPAGYHHLEESYLLGQGDALFEAAVDALMHWGVQRGAGLRVVTSSDLVELGAVALIRLGLGPLAVRAPVRVVALVEEDDRRGFAYGTLPGHLERGEESFVVERDRAGAVTLRIRAFSHPGSVLARWVGPVGTLAQRWITRRYGRVLRP